jgi:LCP family protein required for cell wall assembly
VLSLCNARNLPAGGMALLILMLILSNGASAQGEVTVQERLLLQTATPAPVQEWPVGTYAPPSDRPVTAVPPFVTLVDGPAEANLFNILVLGSDTANSANAGRTDAILIASINRSANTVSLLSIPRDLFVYIPGWTMQRMNAAFGFGEHNGYQDGGYGLLRDTIRYNLGIGIDAYARVDFNGFVDVINALGGVEVSVDCAIQDWRLKSPDLEVSVEENWELFTLPVGVHLMDGDLALWYARSRRTSSDFDRGRRQQDLLRAIWRRLRELGLLSQVPALWGQVNEIVETDITLPDALSLIPVALGMESSNIATYVFRSGEHTRSWVTPGGSSVLLPNPDAVQRLVEHFVQPPTSNRLLRSAATVDVVNANGYPGLDRVAADQLAWAGISAIPAGIDQSGLRSRSVVYDFVGRTKGSMLSQLLEALRLSDDAVIIEPNADRTVDYRVILGGDFRSCAHSVAAPIPTPTPGGESANQ